METSIEERIATLERQARLDRIVIGALACHCGDRDALRADLLHTLEQHTVAGLNSNRMSDQSLEEFKNAIHGFVRTYL
jgi:hypothetical protein